MANQGDLISWDAPEFRFYQKNFGWYISFVALVLLIVGYEVLQKDWFGAVSLFVIACLVAAFALQKPKTITITIGTKGVMSGNVNIPYQSIRHFWIVDTPNHKTLNLETTAYLNRTLILELEDTDSELVREVLQTHIPELDGARETFAQRIMHRLKF